MTRHWNPDCPEGDACDCPGEVRSPFEAQMDKVRQVIELKEADVRALAAVTQVGPLPAPTLGDVHKALMALTARGVTVESIRWVLDNQMPEPEPERIELCPQAPYRDEFGTNY